MRSVLAFAISVLLAGCGSEIPVSPVATPDAATADANLIDAKASDAKPSDTVTSTGLGKTCAANVDCAALLFCQFATPTANSGFCSKSCDQDADCGGGYFCNSVGGKKLCTAAKFCNTCVSASDCSAEAPLCIPGASGASYCSHSCSIGDKSCGAGSSCKQYDVGVNDTACAPDSGACTGDGGQCSPCDLDGDCRAGTVCFSSPSDGKFCAQTCDPGQSGGCPAGFACAAQKSSKYKGLCWKQIGKEVIATCAKGDKGYCDACDHSYECASNRCATKNGKKFCAQPNPCTKATEAADCPYGGEATFCAQSDVGMICVPPTSWNCQGFKACLGHQCKADQVCVNGICTVK